MVAVYGAISVLLYCVVQLGWFGIVQKGHSTVPRTSVEQTQQRAHQEERVINRFNACLERAETNLRKVHACQRQRYGYVPSP
jgi:hypothetical protein